MTPFLRGAALVALLLPPAALLAADGAIGSFRHDKTTVKAADAMAFTTPVDGKPLTLVAVTDFKLDRQAVLDAIDPASGVMEQVHDGRNVVFLRLSSATACGVYAYLSGTAQSMDLGNSFPAHPRTATASRAAGETPSTPDANWLDGLALNYPKQATVKDGLAKGARARFEIAGLDHDGKKIKGTVEMRKEQASWRVHGLSLFFDQ